ncbi:MAG: FG-GAP-like repeat-containing protein [Ignavibacteria bacterium]|nr:FG-GAP-like repeat-containing protein [Ignavibacteria bacterium]
MRNVAFFVMFIMLFGAKTAHGQILARYTFDDGTATDVTGNGHDGRLVGAPSPTDGILGQALWFDGIDDHIGIPTSSELSTETVMVSFWLNVDEVLPEDQVVVNKLVSGVGYRISVSKNSGAVSFLVSGTSGPRTKIASMFPIIPGEWTHIMATYDGVELRLFLHGSLAASSVAPDIVFSIDSKTFLGSTGRGNFLQGAMDHVTIGEGTVLVSTACEEALNVWDEASGKCRGTFADVTDLLGVGDPGHRHFGISVVDVNHDGWVDFYWPNGNTDPFDPPPPSGECPDLIPPPPFDPLNYNTMYLNNGDGTFTEDVAPDLGLNDPWNAMRSVWGDYDNDGRRDLFSHNFIVSTLYHAVPGGPLGVMFEDVNASSGIQVCAQNGTGASWVDLNNDGLLDLYACEWDADRPPEQMVNYMFLNDGDGTFTDISVEAGIWVPQSPDNDNPMGFAFGDYDNDGDQDFFVANSPPAPTRLWRNEGVNGNGVPQFVDVAEEAGVAVTDDAQLGFGASWGDYNNDNFLDLIFTRNRDSRVWRNNGPGGGGVWTFTDVTGDFGLFDLGGFHDANFVDLDNDGWQDIIFVNVDNPDGPNRVFMNNGDPDANNDVTWAEVGALLGLDYPDGAIRGIIPADYDNNGTLDLVYWDRNGGASNRVYRNDARGNNWIQFDLIGTVSNMDAIGARIKVKAGIVPDEPPVTQTREVVAGAGFFDDIPRIQTFGLGKAVVAQIVEIAWPSGLTQSIGPLLANQRYEIIEPAARVTAIHEDVPTENMESSALLELRPNYPNPFNPSTTIRYSLGVDSPVSVRVYNMVGQEVATLVDGFQKAGEQSIAWHGVNNFGQAVASGVYFYKIRAGSAVITQKMLFTK